MKKSIILPVALRMMAFTILKAQSNNSLIGKWETTYEIEGEKMNVVYQFKNEGKKLKCYTLFLKDDKGNGEAYDSIVMADVHFKDKTGNAEYVLKYEGEIYKVQAYLQLINENSLEVSYSYYGYADTEIWRKVK